MNIKYTDEERINVVARWGRNSEIQILGKWVRELCENGEYRQGARVIRVAEKMQRVGKGEIIVCVGANIGIMHN